MFDVRVSAPRWFQLRLPFRFLIVTVGLMQNISAKTNDLNDDDFSCLKYYNYFLEKTLSKAEINNWKSIVHDLIIVWFFARTDDDMKWVNLNWREWILQIWREISMKKRMWIDSLTLWVLIEAICLFRYIVVLKEQQRIQIENLNPAHHSMIKTMMVAKKWYTDINTFIQMTLSILIAVCHCSNRHLRASIASLRNLSKSRVFLIEITRSRIQRASQEMRFRNQEIAQIILHRSHWIPSWTFFLVAASGSSGEHQQFSGL
jgi:hypothetical protein